MAIYWQVQNLDGKALTDTKHRFEKDARIEGGYILDQNSIGIHDRLVLVKVTEQHNGFIRRGEA